MEIAIGLVGLGLGAVAVVSAYMWRANGRYIKMLREEIAQDTKMLQQAQMEGTRLLQEGQKEIMQGLNQIALIAKGK